MGISTSASREFLSRSSRRHNHKTSPQNSYREAVGKERRRGGKNARSGAGLSPTKPLPSPGEVTIAIIDYNRPPLD
jgi:hypothetical protein